MVSSLKGFLNYLSYYDPERICRGEVATAAEFHPATHGTQHPQGDALSQSSRAVSPEDLAQGARDSLGQSCGTFSVPPGHDARVLCKTTGIEEKHPLDTRCCEPARRQVSAPTLSPRSA